MDPGIPSAGTDSFLILVPSLCSTSLQHEKRKSSRWSSLEADLTETPVLCIWRPEGGFFSLSNSVFGTQLMDHWQSSESLPKG